MVKEILAYNKETDNKYRWEAKVENASFKLYIPKWRIPHPMPEKLLVGIYTVKEEARFQRTYTPSEISINPNLAKNPIFAEIIFFEEHTQTYRYDPSFPDSHLWEIGSPYIPKTLLEHNRPQIVYINVEWK